MSSNEQQVVGNGIPQDGTNVRRPPRPVDLVVTRLKAERVQEELKTMPGWQLTAGGEAVDRVREFPTKDLAVVFVNFVAMMASLQEQSLDLSLWGNVVGVTLSAALSPEHREVTQEVLDFARMLG
ncbi:MAG TPA: 4a-hydroxytetrahydrobiopterin dehydratase [Thermoanaerobaculia bacterium]|nr:4a-hydroxytetrahydrobiopterin dehydratase [Thermoanaerobaculia bacterium]